MVLRRSSRSKDQVVEVGHTLLSSQSKVQTAVRNQSTSSVAKRKVSNQSKEKVSELVSNTTNSVEPNTSKRRKHSTVPNGIDKSPAKKAVPSSSGDITDPTISLRARRTRPAEPHHTNATLISPQTSRIVSYSLERKPSSLSFSTNLGETGSTTANILEKAIAHLIECDPGLKTVIDQNHCHLFSPDGLTEAVDPFSSLASGIISQQVSGAAAKSIKNKFVALFNTAGPTDNGSNPHTFPTPAQVVSCDFARLKTAGLSQRKAEYIQGLAEKFVNGELSTEMLLNASDEELLEKLIAVRGIGRWSAEMFACFALKRMDVFSTGDLGIQRGMAAYMGKDVSKLKAKGGGKWKYMSESDMLEHSKKFTPYRSIFMWYMWRIEGVSVEAMQTT